MKPALILLALLTGVFALPWLTARTMRQGWQKWRKAPSRSGYSGAALATVLLRRGGVRHVGVVEKGRLFYERFDHAARDIQLSESVYRGRNLAALAHAALQAGHVLQHAGRDRSHLRQERWNQALRVLVNLLPLLALFILISPGKIRLLPVLILFLCLLAAIQVLTFPAVRDAAERGKKLVMEHGLLPPEEMGDFGAALRSATQRHLAAPLLDCFWLRWLV